MGFEPNLIKILTDFVLPAGGNHYTILCDCTAGDITITLPLIDDVLKGRQFIVKKIDATANRVILQPNVANYFDYVANFIINTKNESVSFTNDGDLNWVVY